MQAGFEVFTVRVRDKSVARANSARARARSVADYHGITVKLIVRHKTRKARASLEYRRLPLLASRAGCSAHCSVVYGARALRSSVAHFSLVFHVCSHCM